MRLVIDQPVEFRGLAVPGMTAEKEFMPLWAVQKLHSDFFDLPAVRFSIKRVPFPLVFRGKRFLAVEIPDNLFQRACL